MNVEFNCNEEDLVEFNLFHYAHSPSYKRQVLIIQILMAVLIFGCVASTFIRYLPVGSFVLGGIFGGIMYFVIPYIYKRSLVGQVRKLLKEGSNISLLGKYEMRLSPDEIHYKTLASETKIKWSSINKVVQNDKYIFIYIGAVQALVIPKSAFTSIEQQKEFLDYVNSNVKLPS